MKKITRKTIFNFICKTISYSLATFGILLVIGSVGALEMNNIPFVQFVVQLVIGCLSIFIALIVSGFRQYITDDYIIDIED